MTPRLRALFYQELSQLLSAGITLERALTFIKNRFSKADQKVISRIQQKLRAGASFSTALLENPRYFGALACEMIRIGEATGQIIQVLETLSAWTEQQAHFREQCHKALLYPLFTLCSAILMLIFLSQVMLPAMASLYQQFHQNLPQSSQQLLMLSNAIKKYGLSGCFFLIFLSIFFYILYARKPRIKALADHLFYFLPGLHAYHVFMLSYRASTQLSLLLRYDIPLLEALTFTAHAEKNKRVQNQIKWVQELLLCGSSFGEAAQKSGGFSAFFIACVQTGEETGTLPHALDSISRYHEARFKEYTARIITWIEPLSLSLMSLLIGWIAYSFYQPLLSLQMF